MGKVSNSIITDDAKIGAEAFIDYSIIKGTARVYGDSSVFKSVVDSKIVYDEYESSADH